MKYIIDDLENDTIVVVPLDREAVGGRVAIDFTQADGNRACMSLDDRLIEDLILALRSSLAESERAG